MDENLQEGMNQETMTPEPDSPPPAPETPAQPAESPATPSKDERLWAMGCHLLALVTCFVGPLILWLVKREDSAYIDAQGKEAVNFQLSILIYLVACSLLTFIVIGALLMPVVWLFDLIFVIIASVKANEGVAYRYPLCIRFIK